MSKVNQIIRANLEILGLNEKEILIYSTLLSLGQTAATEIISTSGLKKGNTYDILYSLEGQGLVRSIKKDGKLNFAVEPPEKLLEHAHKKLEQLNAAEKSIKAILPELNTQYRHSVGKATVRHYEGPTAIKELFEDIYAAKEDPIYGCVDLETSEGLLPEHIIKTLIPKRIRNGVLAYSLIGDSPKAKLLSQKDKAQLRRSMLLDKSKYPLPAELDVYEDKIVMITFDRGESIGLMIQNRTLATTLKSLFRLIFDSRE